MRTVVIYVSTFSLLVRRKAKTFFLIAIGCVVFLFLPDAVIGEKKTTTGYPNNSGRALIASDKNTIEILTVVDTRSLLKDYRNASKDINYPTKLSHKYLYMVAPVESVVAGQATDYLIIKGKVQDAIDWYGTSLNHNADDAIFIYNISK